MRAKIGAFGRGVSLLGLCLAAAGAVAETPVAAPTASWNVDWGDSLCSLIRRSETGSFVLQTIPGSGYWQVRLLSPAWPVGALADPERLRVTLQPSALAVTGRPAVERVEAGRQLVFYGVPESLIAPIAAAQSIRAEWDGRTLLEIPLPSAGRAVTAVRECESSALREWGIDPATQPATPPVPRANAASLIRSGDYPVDALTGGHDGTVVVRLAVGADGRVGDCTPVASSGHAGLDQRTCAIMRQRLRFSPARDAEGNAVPAATITSLTWSIRGRTP